ncbi:transglycosylase SLT domain-containing protein [Peteryoungia algae]|uniref:Lytic transglycosylase domain-containing protein n=1 Tax=Peteryoungia algae TaxID=2919917 RepID=A0ABT0D014_9HYPH|nr:transglycosylase SLT domain-containing protein [Rhizobium sp. SSM4.3]MCJ8238765.1 lytic transglycosylase domain-containing protein [Rhizobium sp. SSM4.3]
MIFRTDRSIALCMAASIVAGLGGCTAIDESVKADLAAAPVANPKSPEMLAATAAEAAMNGTAATAMTPDELAAANPGPAPVIPGTETAAPIPSLKASALSPAAPQTAATDALAMMTTPEQSATGAQQMTAAAASTEATLAPPGVTPAATAASMTATTEQKPLVLAYAAPLRTTALTSFGDPFDTTPPGEPPVLDPQRKPETVGPTRLNALIEKYSRVYEIPVDLVHRVVHRESRYNPAAYSKGNYGLMQIRYNTAKAMGYSGPADGLFDAETNIKYAVKYLKGAWVVADNDHDQAVRLYARGYYYDAKRKGLLHLVQ